MGEQHKLPYSSTIYYATYMTSSLPSHGNIPDTSKSFQEALLRSTMSIEASNEHLCS
jgi:hypothetical protein